MLDIRSKRLVETRKSHECFGCIETINKGEQAVVVTAKEDDKHQRLYLHEECNQVIMKNKTLFNGIYYGCVSEKQKIESKSCYWCLKEIPSGIDLNKRYHGNLVEFCSVKCMDEEELCPF